DISVKDGIVEYASFGDVRFQAEDLYGTRETETRALRLRGDYQLGTLQFNPFVTVSDTQFEQTDLRYFADVRGPATYDIRQDDDYFTITSPIDVTSTKGMLVRQARRFLSKTVDREAAAGLDLTWSVSETLKAEFGFKLRDRSKTRDRFEVTRSGINQPFEPVSKVLTGFLSDEGRAKGPNSFVVFDPERAFAAYGSQLDPRTAPQINNYFKVKERVSSAYAMATYSSDNWLINGGLRLTATALTSDGVERNQTLKTDTSRSVSSDYADVLPSLNVRYEVMPNLYLRASAAKVLTRPSLTDLAAYRQIDDVTRTISARNPDLKPFRANQADLAVEWYFGRDGLLGLGWFHKDIKSFIATRSSQVDLNGTEYTLTQPVNGNSATVSGFEANYQQSFDFLPGLWKHFGVAANYTYTDSSFRDTVSGTGLTYGLPENSEDSYNLTGYYEDDRLSVRVAHNFRGAFLREIPNPVDGIKIRDDYQQTDVSMRWTLSPEIQLTLDVMNVFESQQEEYVYQPRLTDGLFTTGRTWQAGLRAKF
ncbi:MAG: TonB-dependent receptor, partial [Asticcacaulis sp.]